MTRLATRIEVTDRNPELVLKDLAIAKLGATRALPVSGSDTFNIDGGLNDIRASIVANEIRFFVRYDIDVDKYTKLIHSFVDENSERCRLKFRESISYESILLKIRKLLGQDEKLIVEWLNTPQPMLVGSCPKDAIATEEGRAQVLELIEQIGAERLVK